ncbi:MAG TPA: metallophosphoesterase [Gemmatimonadaceae bacterium]
MHINRAPIADSRPEQAQWAARYVRTLVASDWHLGSFSSPAAAHLAQRFLECARATGDRIVLNGDIFEGLFEPGEQAEAAHPAVRELIAEMTTRGQLVRLAGNHDPAVGRSVFIADRPKFGRVLISHGHDVDSLHHSQLGQLGDAISRRMGHLVAVRGAARFAERAASAIAGTAIEHAFQTRCRALVDQSKCVVGIFGHIHRRYLAAGDAYANAGCLTRTRLEYLILSDDGIQLAHLELGDRQLRESTRTSAAARSSAVQ